MNGENIVFFPKYTTLPTGTYYSEFYDVTSYKSLAVEVGNAAIINGATINGTVQESGDLITWADLSAGVVPSAGTTDSENFSNTARWLRLRIIVGGTNASATVWAVGVARDA